MKSRRQFLRSTALASSSLALCPAVLAEEAPSEARYYEKLDNRQVRCKLCPRECQVDDLERGYCGVRENRGGTYYTLVYGNPCTAHIDPIEKKPLFHFLPGSAAFSIATVGCNVLCKFCQNWEISQARPDQVRSLDMPPGRVAELAAGNDCRSIAYTYTEPVVFTEYMYDTATAARERGVKSVMISNGYIQAAPMKDLCHVLDAVKIDLKAFTERFYRELVSGELRPVLDTLVLLRDQNMWTEVVYLVIPEQNDDAGELAQMCQWIAAELGPETPLHFSRFHPQYRLTNLPSTPIATLRRARQIAMDSGLEYVYIGNVPGDPGENTHCPGCGKTIIRRIGFRVVEINLDGAACSHCGTEIKGVWHE